MTPREQAIIDFIREYPYKYPPTVREIAAGVGLKSSSTVHSHLTALVNQGLMIYSLAGMMQLGLGASVIEASLLHIDGMPGIV